MQERVTSKEEILEHALEISKRDGVDALNIRKLAKECGIAIGSVYNYYPNKQSLIKAVSADFWGDILKNQDKLHREGMGFTYFLEQYYLFLYNRLLEFDKSWLDELDRDTQQAAIMLFDKVLSEDVRVNRSIWNMELNQEVFCDYVFKNIIALLRAGESHCRFFIFLLEHLLYVN